jgi:tRNA A-37 threonylcarbamoyl transferase component Bud32
MRHKPPGFDAHVTSGGSSGSRIGSTVLGSFHLLGELGGGSFAVAYLAQQIGTDRHAVVKIPHRRLMEESDGGERIRRRFAAELRASTRVSHPNIAVVYTAGDIEDGMPAIAMEYVPGPMLSKLLATDTPLPPHEASRLGCQIASALAAVHSAGIIHRDVTPRNIIASTDTDGNSRHVLLDFGIAKLDGLANRTAGMLGTPRYMAPEQMRGRAVPQSDMFALGAILWWALTTEKYMAGTEKLAALLARQLEQREPPDPRLIRPSIPVPVARLVSQLLHPDPEQRPGARAFADAWMRVMRDWSQSSAPAGRDARVVRDPDGAGVAARDGTPVVPETLDSTADLSGVDALAPGALGAEARGSRRAGSPGGVDAFRTHANPQFAITLERVLGVMPEWLQDLREAARRHDAPAIVQVCTRIADNARLMRADQLARRSEILARLAENGILDQVTGFVREIEAEFQRWFRELLDSRQRSI